MAEILFSKSFEVIPEKSDLGLYNSLYSFKRDLILFDKVVFPNLDKFCRHLILREGKKNPFEVQLVVKELQNLQEKGLIRDFRLDQNHRLFDGLLKSMSDEDEMLTGLLIGMAEEHEKGIVNLIRNKSSYIKKLKDEKEYDRVYWGLISTLEKLETILVTKLISFYEGVDIVDSFPVKKMQITRVVNGEGKETKISPTKDTINKHNAYCFVLNELPFPSDTTPWEAIVDYRSDADNRLRISRMRTWMQKTLKDGYSEKELKEEYEHLYLEFENSMKYHKIKNQKSGLKVFVTALPELVEDVMKLRFGKIATGIYNSIFTATLEKIQLYEAEASSPGKEVGYNYFANEKF